jgi:CubicO group peptidase (beta-lactamase class C family)/pimeloyl-ACP methyl ester carboxylesterase
MRGATIPLLLLTIVLGLPACTGQKAGRLRTLGGKAVSNAELEATIARAMEKADVAGLSCAILNDGQVVYQKAFGYRDKRAGTLNDEETVFNAASFSKTAFAYLVMLLVEEGAIDLDRPLQAYLDRPLPGYPTYADLEGDERYEAITARMVLSHSTGFPNWRYLTPDGKLTIMFHPGTRYSYSGEGIDLLQMVVEHVTGQGLEALAQEKVFGPLGMTRTSYVWQEGWESNVALPHDQWARPRRPNRRSEADAAGSMSTTAGDYAKLLAAILNAEGRRQATMEEMLEPQIAITSRSMFGPDAWVDTDEYEAIDLSWGLGWGRYNSAHGRAFFHTGHDTGFQNYTVTYAERGTGIVLLSNSDNSEGVAQEIVEAAIGETHSPFDWLGYVPFDPSQAKAPPPPEPVAIEVDPAILQAYAGTYEAMGTALSFKVQDGRLHLSVDGGEWARLYAESQIRFFLENDDARFEFVKDNTGAVTGLCIHTQGLEVQATRVTSQTPQIQEWDVDAGGVTLYVRVAGNPDSGNVLIALHGGPGMSSDYMASLEQLAGPSLAVVRYDQRGAGRSSAPQSDSDYGFEHYVADLEAVRRKIGIETVHLFGHSWGGVLAMRYATIYPQHVRSIVLMGSGTPSIAGARAGQANKVQRIAALQEEGLIPAQLTSLHDLLTSYLSDPRFEMPEELRNLSYDGKVEQLTWKALGKCDFAAEVGLLDQPVLVLWGEDDAFGVSMAEATVSALSNAQVELVLLADCGHFWHECPDAFFAHVRAFLQAFAAP